MKFEVGKTYIRRDGDHVRLKSDKSDDKTVGPFCLIFVEVNRMYYYSTDVKGKYATDSGGDHAFDIISEAPQKEIN